MKHRNVLGLIRIACIVQPGIGFVRAWMALKPEHFYDSIPDRLTIENFFHWHAFGMRGSPAMQLMDCLSEFFDVSHSSISKKQTLQSLLAELPLL